MHRRFLKFILLLSLITLRQFAFSQLHVNSTEKLSSWFGRSGDFSMGVTTISLPEKISLRADHLYYNEVEHILREGRFWIWIGYDNNALFNKDQTAYEFHIDSLGNTTGQFEVEVDLALLNSKNTRNCLIAVGNVVLTQNTRQKITQLLFDPECGRLLELQQLENLEKLTIRKNMNEHRYYEEYPGDPFLLKEIAQLRSLEEMNFIVSFSEEGTPFTLDGSSEKLFSSENLRAVNILGIPYLPVSANAWQHIEYFHTSYIYFPELINLAVVFHHLKKDTSAYSNWSYYLQFADTSTTLSIPLNGKYQTKYSSGQVLCEGTYKNGLPHGDWKFWYEDGQLCEHRYYNEGEREGRWYFLRPLNDGYNYAYYPEIDTLLIMEYTNDTLIYRQIQQIDESHLLLNGCNTGHDYHGPRLDALYTTENWVRYSKGQVVIQKEVRQYLLRSGRFYSSDSIYVKPYPQLPSGLSETWTYSTEGWTHLKEDYCNHKKMIYSRFLQGMPGESAYFYSTTEFETHRDGEISKEINVRDYRNCVIQQFYYTAENDTSELKLKYADEYEIGEHLGPYKKW